MTATPLPAPPAPGTPRAVGTKLAVSDYAAMARAHNPYGDGRAAARIAEIVAHAA